MSDIRNKIWYFLVDAKTNELLSGLIAKKYKQRDLHTNILLVIATSSSIGGWSLWQSFALIWAIIIGLSQLITVLKPYLLFPKYVKVFSEKGLKWQFLTVDLEELWYEVNNYMIDSDKASERFFKLKKQSLEFDNVPNEIIFYRQEKLKRKAEYQCNAYLKKI